MKKETFLACVGEIDDDLVEENAQPVGKHTSMRVRYLATAACICVVLGGSTLAGILTQTSQRTGEQSTVVAQKGEEDTLRGIENAYQGDGTGEFIYNGKRYVVVNNEQFMLMNSIPEHIDLSNIGANVANNISDTANNNIGNLYEYVNEKGESELVVQGWDGSYNLAVEVDEEDVTK